MCDHVQLLNGKTLWSLGDLIKEGFDVHQDYVGKDVALDDSIYFCCFWPFVF
jgi:hypothetical protein